jgi:hypothetical protein
MTEPTSYKVTCNLGGTFDEYALEGVNLVDVAYDRLWEELTHLVLRGTHHEFVSAFKIVPTND